MPTTSFPDFFAILHTLAEHGAAFIIVGGVSAALHGALYATADVDIVHSRDAANVERLLRALDALEARYRIRPDLKPNASHLSSPGHQLLMTPLGPLDVLGVIGSDWSYETLLPHSEEMDIGGRKMLVLDLPTLIRTKEEAGNDKDRAVLPLLRRTLAERDKRS